SGASPEGFHHHITKGGSPASCSPTKENNGFVREPRKRLRAAHAARVTPSAPQFLRTGRSGWGTPRSPRGRRATILPGSPKTPTRPSHGAADRGASGPATCRRDNSDWRGG